MLSEEEFFKELETRTGLKHGKDFWFIFGTETPFFSNYRSMNVAKQTAGFEVQSKDKNGNIRTFMMRSGPKNLDIISLWLQPNISEENKIELISKMMGGLPIIKTE